MKMRASYNWKAEYSNTPSIIADMKMRASYNVGQGCIKWYYIIEDMKMRASYNTSQKLLFKDRNPNELDYDNYLTDELIAQIEERVHAEFQALKEKCK